MHVDCWDCNSFIAYSYFQGQYTATSTTFQFNYTLRNFGPNPDGWYDGVYDPYGSFSFGITVEDLTDSTILYSGLPTDTSDTISVSTPIGNDINVFVYMEFSMTGNAWLDHSTAVVPEPVSTTLFLVGSATLGFRQWRKKRAA